MGFRFAIKPKKPEKNQLTKRCRVIAPAVVKGGVGKTALIVSLAGILAEKGYRILVVDTDDNMNATKRLDGQNYDWQYTIADVLEGKCKIDDALVKTDFANDEEGTVWFIGANDSTQVYQRNNANDPDKQLLLADELEKIKDRFDWIFIDPPPTKCFWNFSALFAADYLITPLLSGQDELDDFEMIKTTMLPMITEVNPNVALLGAFLNMPRSNTKFYKYMKTILEKNSDQLFKTEIPEDIKMRESASACQPIHIYSPSSNSAKAYKVLAEEVISKCLKIERKAKVI